MEEAKKKTLTLVPDVKLVDEANTARKKKKTSRKLIFLIGFANTGKDTFAKILSEISVEPVIRVSFADALKTECYPVLGKEYDKNNDDREWKDAHRAEIIAYGEGKKQENGMYYWIKRALDPILNMGHQRDSDIPHIIVTDCRRVEEILWLKHFKLGHFNELSRARDIYDPHLYAIHRDGAQDLDKDYLTHLAVEYAAETKFISQFIKNYGNINDLENRIKDLYVTKIR